MYNKSEAYQGPKYFSYNGKGVFASGSGSSSDDVRNLSLWHTSDILSLWLETTWKYSPQMVLGKE